jgi:hypothetical protein
MFARSPTLATNAYTYQHHSICLFRRVVFIRGLTHVPIICIAPRKCLGSTLGTRTVTSGTECSTRMALRGPSRHARKTRTVRHHQSDAIMYCGHTSVLIGNAIDWKKRCLLAAWHPPEASPVHDSHTIPSSLHSPIIVHDCIHFWLVPTNVPPLL